MPMPAFAPALRPLDEATFTWEGVAVAPEVLGAVGPPVSTVGEEEAEEDKLPITEDVAEYDEVVCDEKIGMLETMGRTEEVELTPRPGAFGSPPLLVLLKLDGALLEVVEAVEKTNVLL